MFVGLPNLDPFVRCMDLDPDPDPSLFSEGVERNEIILEK